MSNDANIKLFEADLEKLAEGLDVTMVAVVQKITWDAFTRLTLKTPVDTGRARASWDVKIGSPSPFIPKEGTTKMKDPGSTIGNISEGDVVFITTALDYMRFLEGGSSKQAPAGMVEVSLAEIEVEIEAILGQL